jgi:hypothetical protein
MTPAELEHQKQWARQWREAGPLLEQFAREELAAMDEGRRLADMLSLFELGYQHQQPRVTSGLVDQQRLFHRGQR